MGEDFKEKIDITMTATLRPDIFNETLSDIKKFVIGAKDLDLFTLILNIDMIGEDVPAKKMLKIAYKNFTNVKYNISEQPSFPKAVKWVWGQTTSNFVFHIEDDWQFFRKVDLQKMTNILNNNKSLSSLRLYKYKTPTSRTIKTFMCKWIYQDEGYYLSCDWRRQFGLNPILIKKQFIDEALPRMKDHINPEKQFRYTQDYMKDLLEKWQYGIYTSPGNLKMVDDRGRRWIRNKDFGKPKQGSFVKWEKKK